MIFSTALRNHFIFVFIMDATTLQLVYWDNKYGNIYTRTRHISSFVITSPNPRIGNENGVVIIEDERLQKNEAFKFIYYIVMLLLDPFTISSTIPCLKYIYSNYMFSMFSLCVYMLYAAHIVNRENIYVEIYSYCGPDIDL